MDNPSGGKSQSQLFSEELFRKAPVGLWIEDFSKVHAIIEDLKSSGISDFGKYFKENSEIVRKCAASVRVVDVNQAAVDLHKAGTREQLLNQLGSTFTAKSFEVFTRELLTLINQGQDFTSRTELQTLQGEPLHCLVKAFVDPNFDSWSRVYVSITDITPVINAEKSLRQSEAHYRSLYDSAPTGYQSLDKDGHFLHVNQTILDLLGYSRNDLLGFWFGDFLVPEDQSIFRENFPKFIAKGHVEGVRFKLNRKDGSILHVEFDGRTVVAADGKFLRTHCVMRNITSNVVFEQERDSLARQHKLVLDSAGDGILGINADGTIDFVNPRAEQITGWRADELLGKAEHAVLHHTDSGGIAIPREECPILLVLSAGRSDSGKNLFWRKDGTSFPVEYNCQPILVDGGFHGAVLTFRDVSEKESLEQQLALSQKLESVGQLAGGLAHDFNNILQVMMGETELALDSSSTHGECRQALKVIKGVISKASGLTRQLLAFSRCQVLDKRVENLDSLVDHILEMLQRLVPENVEISFATNAGGVLVLVDRGQIEQVLVNLCINARDAMPGGGQLNIATDVVELDHTFLEHHPWARIGSFARITVADTGCGMDVATQKKIFEPFFTTKAEESGTGLGLSTAYGIVKQHEGFINVYSELGNGTVFRLYFPVSNEEDDAIKQQMAEVELVGGSETILIAEDNAKVRAGLSKTLTRAGYHVLTAENGLDALHLWRESSGKIDLLLLDVVMPKLNGQEVVSAIREVDADLPVIFCSGYSQALLNGKLLQDKNIALIEKPLGAGLLLGAVRQSLDAGNC